MLVGIQRCRYRVFAVLLLLTFIFYFMCSGRLRKKPQKGGEDKFSLGWNEAQVEKGRLLIAAIWRKNSDRSDWIPGEGDRECRNHFTTDAP